MKKRIEFWFLTVFAAALLIAPSTLFVDGLIWTLTGEVRFWRTENAVAQFILAFIAVVFAVACFFSRPTNEELEAERTRAEAKRQARRPQMPQLVADFPIGFESSQRSSHDHRHDCPCRICWTERFNRESA